MNYQKLTLIIKILVMNTNINNPVWSFNKWDISSSRIFRWLDDFIVKISFNLSLEIFQFHKFKVVNQLMELLYTFSQVNSILIKALMVK